MPNAPVVSQGGSSRASVPQTLPYRCSLGSFSLVVIPIGVTVAASDASPRRSVSLPWQTCLPTVANCIHATEQIQVPPLRGV